MHIDDMTARDCIDFVATRSFGHLGCLEQGRPYVLPIHFACKDEQLYSFSMPGSKIQSMRANPEICLQIEDIASDQVWTSVVLHGRYQELPDTGEWHTERMYAWSLLQQQRPNWWEPGGYDDQTHDLGEEKLVPIFYSIKTETMTGRRARAN